MILTGVHMCCTLDINECDSNPCQNGGVCSQGSIDEYICTCEVGFTGVNCENESILDCTTDPVVCNAGEECLWNYVGAVAVTQCFDVTDPNVDCDNDPTFENSGCFTNGGADEPTCVEPYVAVQRSSSVVAQCALPMEISFVGPECLDHAGLEVGDVDGVSGYLFSFTLKYFAPDGLRFRTGQGNNDFETYAE